MVSQEIIATLQDTLSFKFISLSWNAFIVLNFVVHTKSVISSCVTNEKGESLREKLKPSLLSHLRTPGQSRGEVGVNVGCLFGKLQKMSDTDSNPTSSTFATASPTEIMLKQTNNG